MRRKIGYDARMIAHSGIGVRIQHILKYWPLSESEAELYVFGNPELLKKHNLPIHAKIVPYFAKIYSLKEILGHPQMAEMDFLDIPHFNIPIFYIRKCIVTIHDLIPFHFKPAHGSFIKRLYINFILRIISLLAYKIVAVSKYTRDDFESHFANRNQKLEIIYNGIDPGTFFPHPTTDIERFRSDYQLPAEFLLAVGIGKKHKNFDFLVKNLSSLWEKKTIKLPLVIGGLGKDVPQELLDWKNRFPNQLYFLEHLSYQELPKVYQSAQLFLFASLFEGFGFPVLESQAVGTPVLSSQATVLPEILGNTALLFDPHEDNAFQEKLLQILQNPELRADFRKKGLQNVKRFHWEIQIARLRNFYLGILA